MKKMMMVILGVFMVPAFAFSENNEWDQLNPDKVKVFWNVPYGPAVSPNGTTVDVEFCEDSDWLNKESKCRFLVTKLALGKIRFRGDWEVSLVGGKLSLVVAPTDGKDRLVVANTWIKGAWFGTPALCESETENLPCKVLVERNQVSKKIRVSLIYAN